MQPTNLIKISVTLCMYVCMYIEGGVCSMYMEVSKQPMEVDFLLSCVSW